jgi:FkbM family methyltransferase
LITHYGRTFRWRELISAGDTCVDIGAHCGDTSVVMAVCAYGGHDRRGTVLCAEPNTDVLPVLQLNAVLNQNLAEMIVVPKAITPEDGQEVTISDHGNNNCNGGIIHESFSDSLKARLQQVTANKIVAEGIRLDRLLRESLTAEQFSRLTFIKTDCEGFDKEIIRSVGGLINSLPQKPTLFVEWFDWFTDDETADLFAAIEEIEYRPYHPVTWQAIGPGQKVSDLMLRHKASALINRGCC